MSLPPKKQKCCDPCRILLIFATCFRKKYGFWQTGIWVTADPLARTTTKISNTDKVFSIKDLFRGCLHKKIKTLNILLSKCFRFLFFSVMYARLNFLQRIRRIFLPLRRALKQAVLTFLLKKTKLKKNRSFVKNPPKTSILFAYHL
jgi:hypothetical protein